MLSHYSDKSIFNYEFEDTSLRLLALTPPCYNSTRNNQRLEFLGDSILSAVITTLIFNMKPSWKEGHMSKLRSYLVGTECLFDISNSLNLQKTIYLLHNTKQPLSRKSIVDCFEACIGSIYIDCGNVSVGYETVFNILQNIYFERIEAAGEDDWISRDFKTALQEKAATLGFEHPIYRLLRKIGVEHKPEFAVEVQVGPHRATAVAQTRKAAESLAAKELLITLPT